MPRKPVTEDDERNLIEYYSQILIGAVFEHLTSSQQDPSPDDILALLEDLRIEPATLELPGDLSELMLQFGSHRRQVIDQARRKLSDS